MIDITIKTAREAGALALRYFKTQPKVSYKLDQTPVTRADIEAERLIRKIITSHFPDHGIIGEELENTNPKAKHQWVIDPIDGTKSFIRGISFWSTLIALLENGKPIIGISFSPTTDELFIAQKGKGTYLNDKRIHVSKISNLKHAYLTHSSVDAFEKKSMLTGFMNLYKSTNSHRGFGDSFGYHLLIQGKVDIMVEAKDKLYDIAAPSILVEEAGGKFSDLNGKFSLTSDCAVATNGLLHDQILKILNS
ncbi:histidinol phosphate phosphatase [Candidatus Curtissbacteria bacterium]|nr:histidinol phosphate phosphatase [Candidatus Curtissbacteria bacterium]